MKRIFVAVITATLLAAGGLAVLPSAPAQAQEESDCLPVQIQPGDSLSGVALRYLGAYGLYPQIVQATNAAAARDARYSPIANANRIQVGQTVCVPAGEEVSVPAPTATATPVPSPTALPPAASHPLRIDAMRAVSYPGSELTIERAVGAGVNYRRFVASYRSEGLKQFGLLTVPNGTPPESGWPVIVFNHGYIPPEMYRTTERYGAYVDGFARNGYIVFKPDYRGHGSSEGEPISAQAGPGYTADVLNAVASLKQYPLADPNRIGMWGHSMGGSITLRAMVVSDDIRAGVIWAGVVASYPDLLERFEVRGVPVPDWFAAWRDQFTDTYGTPEENPAFWQAISPNAYLADLSGPIQLHHATGDVSVPVQYSDVLKAQLDAIDAPVEYFRYNGDNHNISVNFAAAMAQSVAFFDKHVKNAPAQE